MMIYQEFYPKPPLADYIEKFWYVNLTHANLHEKIFPHARIHLILNLSKPYKLFTNKDLTEFQVCSEYFLSGIQDKYLTIENPENVENVGIEFKPQGLSVFTNHEITLATNSVENAGSIFTGLNKTFIAKLKKLDINQKFQAMEEFCLENLKSEPKDFKIVASIVNLIEENPDITLDAIVNKTGYSKKHITHIFKNITGTTIKNLSYIYKFQKALTAIQKGDKMNWSEIAANLNYYDQPYFIKQFKKYSGFTPNEFMDIIYKFKQNPSNFINIKDR